MKRRGLLWLLLASTAAAGAEIPADLAPALDCAGTLEFISLNPVPWPGGPTTPLLAGYPVLGRVKLRGREEREVLEALRKSMQEPSPPPQQCFLPRHALVWDWEKHVYLVLICLQCQRMTWTRDFDFQAWRPQFPVSSSAREVFLAVHHRHGVPLAP